MNQSSLNITEIIIETINQIFQNLFSNIDESLYSFLDDLLFINKNFLKDSYFEKIFGATPQEGILLIANSILIGFILYYLVRYLLSNFIGIQTSSPTQFIFKLLFICIAINFSYFICEQLISFFSLISSSIREIGEILFQKNICFAQLVQDLNTNLILSKESFNLFSFDGLITGFIFINLFNLIFTYSFRYILLKLLILVFPFAIISLTTQSTASFFHMWIRLFISLLSIQVGASIVLLLMFSISYEMSDLFSKLIYIGSISILSKINSLASQLFNSPSIENSSHFSNLNNLLKWSFK